MAEKKTGGGSKLTRTQTVTVRFDPKLKYLAELAARKQRRTVSSFIEWAVEEALNQVVLQVFDNISLNEQAETLWDVDEAERFARLALSHPELLTHDEQVLWKVILDSNLLSLSPFGYKLVPSEKITMDVLRETVFPEIRKNWKVFNEIAQGIRPQSDLPKWEKTSSSEIFKNI